jgi:peptide-methionine (S)-S-oxide reductase
MWGKVNSFMAAVAMLAAIGSAEGADKGNGAADRPGLATAIFAGGCFWCMEPPYDHLDGVISTTSGYTGGKVENPTYEQVSSGRTGHAESVRVEYDPAKVSYEKLLDVFWHNVDPFAVDAQFCDHGDQYRSAIFPADAEERQLAEASLAKVRERFAGKKIATKIEDAGKFWPAEDYHQDYYIKNPLRYKFYRFNCGRDARLEQIWGPKAGS